LEDIKKELFLQSDLKTNNILKKYTDEKDISAIKQKKKKQTRIQRKNGFSQWPQSIESPSCQRKKKTDCF